MEEPVLQPVHNTSKETQALEQSKQRSSSTSSFSSQTHSSPSTNLAISYIPSSPSQIALKRHHLVIMDSEPNDMYETSRVHSKGMIEKVLDMPSSSSLAQDASNSYYTPPLTGAQNRAIDTKQRLLDPSDTPSKIGHSMLSSSPLADATDAVQETSKDNVTDFAFQAPISPRPSTPAREGERSRWMDIEYSPTIAKYLDVDAATPVLSDRDSNRGSRTPRVRGRSVMQSPPRAPKVGSFMLEFGMGPMIEDESSPTTHTKAAARRRRAAQEQLELSRRQSPKDPESSPPQRRKVAIRTITRAQSDILSSPESISSPEGSPVGANEDSDESELDDSPSRQTPSPKRHEHEDTGADGKSNEEEEEEHEEPHTIDRVAQLESENMALKARMSKMEKRMNSIVDILSQVVEQCDTFDKHLAIGTGEGSEGDLIHEDVVNHEEDDTDHDLEEELDEQADEDAENQNPLPPHHVVAPPVRRCQSERGPFETVPLGALYSPETLEHCKEVVGKRRASSLELSMTESFRLQKKLRLHEEDVNE